MIRTSRILYSYLNFYFIVTINQSILFVSNYKSLVIAHNSTLEIINHYFPPLTIFTQYFHLLFQLLFFFFFFFQIEHNL